MNTIQLLCSFGFGLLTLCVQFNWAAASGTVYCSNGTHLEQIALKKYICCNGKFDKRDSHGRLQKCCEIKRTDENGRVTTESVLYNPKVKQCCGRELLDLPKHRNQPGPTCCGGYILANQTKSFCCNNITYTKSDQAAYCHESGSREFTVRRDEMVCPPWAENGMDVKIHKSKRGWDCCGKELLYSKNQTHFCYNKKEVWPRGARVADCGDTVYDKNKYACCENENLIPIQKSGSTNAKYLDIGPDFGCLNGRLVDKDLVWIARTKNKKFVVPKHFKPCGDTYYDPNNSRTQVACCKGVVNHADPHMNVTCCGTEFIDTSKHICCNNTKIPVTSTLSCCGNKPFDRITGDECCGTEVMNSSYLCCKTQSSMSIPIIKGPGHNKCCGTQTYDIKDMTCCAGEPKKLKPNQICSSHSGQVIDIATSKPGQIIQMIKGHPDVMLPGIDSEIRNTGEPDCLSCNISLDSPEDCVKRFGFVIYIEDIRKSSSSTFLQVVVHNPLIKMELQTVGDCNCFKKGELYLFYTNRNLVGNIKKPGKQRFSRKDVFRVIKGKYPRYSGTKRCRINRYQKKSNRS